MAPATGLAEASTTEATWEASALIFATVSRSMSEWEATRESKTTVSPMIATPGWMCTVEALGPVHPGVLSTVALVQRSWSALAGVRITIRRQHVGRINGHDVEPEPPADGWSYRQFPPDFRLPGQKPSRTTRVVHAPGRPVAARIPQAARGHRDARIVPAPGHGLRNHLAAGPPARRRCRDLLLRHRHPAEARRHRRGHRPRRRPGAGHPGAHRRRRARAAEDGRRGA